MSDYLGLIVDVADHEPTINSFAPPPVAYRAVDLSKLPKSMKSPVEVWHQGPTNSCAGHAGAAAMSDTQWAMTGDNIRYSPWFCYIQSQRAGGFFGKDEGTSISSVLKSLDSEGCCLESLAPRPDRYNTKFSDEAYRDAKAHDTVGNQTCVDLRNWDDLVAWLTDMRAVVIGGRWYSGQRSNTGVESKDVVAGGSFLGYHARELFGWETVDGVIVPRCRNSHGTGWGQRGFSAILQETWDWYVKDSNFFALGFAKINERIVRRDWSKFDVLASNQDGKPLLV